MDSPLTNVGLGILANVLTIPTIIVLNWLSRFVPSKKFEFFGIARDRRFHVYFGCIQLGDNMVGAGESAEVRRYERFFHTWVLFADNGLSWLARIVFAAVDITGIPSCPGTFRGPSSSFLTLGTSMHTESSGYFQSKIEPRVHFDNGTLYLPGHDGLTDFANAVLVKVARDGRAYFYAAGFDAPGTLAASRYLTDNWRSLYDQYGASKSFFVHLQRHGADVVEVARGEL